VDWRVLCLVNRVEPPPADTRLSSGDELLLFLPDPDREGDPSWPSVAKRRVFEAEGRRRMPIGRRLIGTLTVVRLKGTGASLGSVVMTRGAALPG
jgi:hypothetical protein